MEPMHAVPRGSEGGGCDSNGSQFIGPTGLLPSVIAWLLVARVPSGGREIFCIAFLVLSKHTKSMCFRPAVVNFSAVFPCIILRFE